MRIGMIAPPWIPVPPPAYGGIESMVDVLARGLAAAGHEVLLAAASGSSCPVTMLPGTQPGDGASVGSCSEELRHCLIAHDSMGDVDVIHDHTLAGALCGRHLGIPRVVTAHGPFTSPFREIYAEAATSSHLIAISEHQASTAPAGTVSVVIHHGIDTGQIPFGAGRGGYAFFLGRMDPSKGVLQAMEAAELAGLPLRIAAKMRTDAEKEYFAAVIRPRLGSGAEYLGEVTTEEKYRLLADATALINPLQWNEPFGLVMLESLAAGTPVVATPRGSVTEIVRPGETGFFSPTVRGLAGGLAAAGSLDRAACRRSVQENFSSAGMVRKHIDLYLAVLDQPPLRSRAPSDEASEAGTVSQPGSVLAHSPRR